jgi:tetratricopeptide (TPR) repeat protein
MVARLRSAALELRFEMGTWDEALAEADVQLQAEEGQGATQQTADALIAKAEVLVARGLAAEAEPILRDLVPAARHIGSLQSLAPVLAIAASFEALRGQLTSAKELIGELELATRDNPGWRSYVVADAVRVSLRVPDRSLAERMLEETTSTSRRNLGTGLAARAALAEVRGTLDEALELYVAAAELWASYGHRLEHGHALLGQGRCLALFGRLVDAHAALDAGRTIFDELGARPLIDETERWIRRIAT